MSKYGVFSGLYFPSFGLNTVRMQDNKVFSPNAGKYRPEKTPYLDTSHAVQVKELLLSPVIYTFQFNVLLLSPAIVLLLFQANVLLLSGFRGYRERILAEAAAGGFLLKKVSLEFFQNSHKKTCSRVSFKQYCRHQAVGQ